jgi:hypothetical protein
MLLSVLMLATQEWTLDLEIGMYLPFLFSWVSHSARQIDLAAHQRGGR